VTNIDERRIDRRAWCGLVLLTLACAALRLAVVEMPAADLLQPATEGAEARGRSSHGEELSRGNIAYELSHGPLMPLLDYQWADFFGGSLVTGILAVPSYRAFGPSLFALKLVPVVTSLFAPLLAFLILNRTASRRAAWIGAWLLAITPPGYTVLTTIAWGTHLEGNVLTLLAFWLYVRARTREGAGALSELLLGVVLGFGVYYGYGALLTVATLGVFELLRDKLFFLTRRFALDLAGFVIGFSPWLVYNVRHRFGGLTLYDDDLARRILPENPSQLLGNVWTLFADQFPKSLALRDLGPLPREGLGPAMGWLILGAALLGLATLVREDRELARRSLARRIDLEPRHLNLLFPAHALLFTGAYAPSWFFRRETSDYLGDVRYVAILYPPLALLLAVGLARSGELHGWVRRASLVLVAAVVAVFGLGSLRLVDPNRAGLHRATPGYDLVSHGRWLVVTYGTEPDRMRAIVEAAIERREPDHRKELLVGMSRTMFALSRDRMQEHEEFGAAAALYRATAEELVRTLPPDYARYFEWGEPRPAAARDPSAGTASDPR